ncbi:MAG: hypothetical protein HZY76_01335 [Anaerolineae bacterium]|nr:MAG: hypothetical protein HZY76_01335 [Anaerolineae bacterium]
MLLISVIMAVFGIYQVRAWTFADLYNWGFVRRTARFPPRSTPPRSNVSRICGPSPPSPAPTKPV